MEPTQIALLVLALFLLLLLFLIIKTIQVIPQASAAIVERFGRYSRTLRGGTHAIWPFIEIVRNRIDLRE